MAILKSKGTAILVSISSTYTALDEVQSISVSGMKSLSFPTTSLAGGAFMTKAPNGYVETPNISVEKSWDPANTVDAFIKTTIATPVATNVKITYTNSGPTSVIYSCATFGVDENISLTDPVKATITMETSGAPS